MFEELIATIVVTIGEREFRASVVKQEAKYFLMAQKGHQEQSFDAPNDDEATAHGMALMGQILKQELEGSG